MSRPPQYRLWRPLNLIVLAGLFAVSLSIGGFVGFYGWLRAGLPSVGRLEHWQPSLVTKVYSVDGEVIAEFASERREIVPLDQVPEDFIHAILATEDRTFYQHHGIVFRRLVSVAIPYLLRGDKSQGASTITMQLSRNLFLSPEKRLVRKLKEMILADEIEARYDKSRILEMYVNQVYFGSGGYGIESASRLYFGKPATELDLAESALLAGIIQSPSRQSPRVSMDAAMARRATVFANMVRVGDLTPDEAAGIRDQPIDLAAPLARAGADNYFAEHVRRKLEQMLGTEAVWQGGYRVYTTLDTRLQTAAEEVLEKHLLAIERTLGPDKIRRQEWLERREAGEQAPVAAEGEFVAATPYLQGMLVSVDLETGGIVAMVGGRSFEESKFNRVTQGLRQPGSVFKPFVYSAAVRSGFPISHVVQDDPISMEAGDGEIWEPQNFDHEFRGPVTLRRALANSINVPTVRLMFEVGVRAVIDYARDAGITTPLPPVLSLALGAADVIPIETLRAYTIFPQGGVRVDPISITRIEDRNGVVVRAFSPSTTRVLTPQEAYIITSVLENVVDHGTARFGVRGQGFEWPAGGKTGTTNDSTDAWFVGFTPRYVTLTWVGFDRKQRIRFNGTGGVLAAPIWTDFMKVAHEELEIPWERFPRPDGLDEIEVTTTTGMLAAAFCGMPSYVEIVIPGTAPEHYCRTPVEPGVPLIEGPLRGDPRSRGQEPEPVGDDFLF